MILKSSLRHRSIRGAGHLASSLVIVLGTAALVFGLWYPDPYRSLSGGFHLFALLVAVDVTLGPLATFVVSKPEKSVREWRMDVALIVLLQLLALGYGLWSLYQARPVYMAFEIDRMRAVHAVDVVSERLHMAPEGLKQLPSWGPGLVALRGFKDGSESAEATMAALQGVELGFRPDLWLPYDQAKPQVKAIANPVQKLLDRFPERRAEIEAAIADGKRTPDGVKFLPLHGRTQFWTALIDGASAEPFAYVNLDPYDAIR